MLFLQTEKLIFIHIYFFLFAMFVDPEFNNAELYYHIMSYAHASSHMNPYKEHSRTEDVEFPLLVTYDNYNIVQFDFHPVVYRFNGYRKKFKSQERNKYIRIIKYIQYKLLYTIPIESGQKMVPINVPMGFRSDRTEMGNILLVGPSSLGMFSELRTTQGLKN